MRRKRRLHKPGFKATVALTANRAEMTMAQMVKKFDVQAAQITQWKNQLMESAESAFDEGDRIADDHEQEVMVSMELRAKIGELSMEVDFLERGLGSNHGPRGKRTR